MAAPPPFASPLPPGWTEHPGPNGQPYYHNVTTGASSWVRPLPGFPLPPSLAPPAFAPQLQQVAAAGKKKKEKPLHKVPIPGAPEWLRVTTTAGNVFYTHTGRKESVWTVPAEIEDGVKVLEEREAKEKEAREEKIRVEEEGRRVKKRKAAAGTGDEPLGEVVSKKARVDDAMDEDAPIRTTSVTNVSAAATTDPVQDDASDSSSSSDSEDEDKEWQVAAAAQLAKEAAEAEAEKARVAEEEKLDREAEEERRARAVAEGRKALNIPDKVDISVEEGKVLFKTLLRERAINPLLPWDAAVPLFITDPRYVLLPSVAARREAFDEYCRERAREIREERVRREKEGASADADSGDAADADARAKAKAAYDALLRSDVTSTRTQWAEWRRKWKKDRRFWGWGRDDRERERRFREWVKELGEEKRAAAQKAERDFFALLKEQVDITADTSWKEVKQTRALYKDPRYDAVGSSSLREELFATYLKSLSASASADHQHDSRDTKSKAELTAEEKEQLRREKKERAVRAREDQVRAEMQKVDADIGRSRSGLDKEEGEREFMTMLTDAVREPTAKWHDVLPRLETDPRFMRSQLPANHRIHLFHAHLASLRTKHLSALHALFAQHAPSLATPFDALPLSLIQASTAAQKLGLGEDEDERALEDEYTRWQRTRWTEARAALDTLLGENAFVEFWGRLGKVGGVGVDGLQEVKVEMDDVGEAGGEEETKVDMKALAKSVDVGEIQKVLKHDKRYTMFDHVPEQRESWIRDYLSQLSAPKLSVHVD